MIPHPSLHWNEILAAYADGELEGRDDLALLKQRVEDWLSRHPEGSAELAEYRQLKQLWQQTTAAEPEPATWRRMFQEMQAKLHRPPPVRATWRRALGAAVALAACVAIGLSVWLAQGIDRAVTEQRPPISADEEPFSVAAAHEVEILNVDGADTSTLVIGEPPVKGPLELAAPGEVTVTSMQPAARDSMIPEVRMQGPGRPMIWARAETD
jgi:anti-sigma factor RsiW